MQSFAAPASISVVGDVKTSLTISLDDLKKMDAFHIANVTLLKEKKQNEPEGRIGVFNYKGVLLRDILEKAGMKHVRKYEPGVYIRVIGSSSREVVFSFGEIFYSSIGRSVMLAYEKDGKSLSTEDGLGELVVSTDLRSGRGISGVREIRVERVDISMLVYEDMKKNVIRPPTSAFLLSDKKAQKSMQIGLEDLKKLDTLYVRDAVLTGECAGFHGVYSFKGVSLRSLLEKLGVDPYSGAYDRYVVISSENGFSATFSFGEVFNSRLSDDIVIAYEKDGKPLNEEDAVAMSAVREDSTGGRSVRRISKIEMR
jgi:DMSO/TMAO reductase YedYZ molybdopterin-dependent catalytic subunit